MILGTVIYSLISMAAYILLGLADENESVRDAALGAGHVLVEHYATTLGFFLLLFLKLILFFFFSKKALGFFLSFLINLEHDRILMDNDG